MHTQYLELTELDHSNTRKFCARLNRWIQAEAAAVLVFGLAALYLQYWLWALCCVPFLMHVAARHREKDLFVDALALRNNRNLQQLVRRAQIKVGLLVGLGALLCAHFIYSLVMLVNNYPKGVMDLILVLLGAGGRNSRRASPATS
jgi:hypothetical protein